MAVLRRSSAVKIAVFLIVYACAVGLVLGAILVITRDGKPLDEKAFVQKWDHALQRLGLDF